MYLFMFKNIKDLTNEIINIYFLYLYDVMKLFYSNKLHILCNNI